MAAWQLAPRRGARRCRTVRLQPAGTLRLAQELAGGVLRIDAARRRCGVWRVPEWWMNNRGGVRATKESREHRRPRSGGAVAGGLGGLGELGVRWLGVGGLGAWRPCGWAAWADWRTQVGSGGGGLDINA